MNMAKSTRRVMSLWRMGSPTWLLQTGRPWLAPSSKWLPRTTVQRGSLGKARRGARPPPQRAAPHRGRGGVGGGGGAPPLALVGGGGKAARGGGPPADIDQGLE